MYISYIFYLGMRRFLVDRRTCPDAGGSNELETHPNIEEPHEAPGHPELEPNMDNFTSEFDPNKKSHVIHLFIFHSLSRYEVMY